MARKGHRFSLNLPVYVYDLFMSNLTMYIVCCMSICLHLKDDFGTWYTLPNHTVGTYTVNLAPEPWIISFCSSGPPRRVCCGLSTTLITVHCVSPASANTCNGSSLFTAFVNSDACRRRTRSVSCGSLGSFPKSGPYRHWRLPKCPGDLDFHMNLYTRSNQNAPRIITNTIIP